MRIRFDWSQYRRLARELACCSRSDPVFEAKQRSAISRAYYSLFIPARNHLRSKERKFPPKDKPTHAFVIEEFTNSADHTRQQIGTQLDQLRKRRNNADYDDKEPDLGWFADFAIELADDTAKLIVSL